jgi:HEAT repeat protein
LEHQLDSVEDPEMTRYVALAIGRFATLDAVAAGGQKVDPLSALDRALEAKYPSAVRTAAAASLAQHAARLRGDLADPRPVAALTRALEQGEPEFRQTAVFALGFFGGDDATRSLRNCLNDDDRFVRYNAAVALARRGDDAALGTVREMLSPTELEQVIALESPREKRAKIEAIELEALGALQVAVNDHKPELARSLRPQVEAEARSGLVSVRTNAQALLKDVQAAESGRKP